jgi:hypothetical protein
MFTHFTRRLPRGSRHALVAVVVILLCAGPSTASAATKKVTGSFSIKMLTTSASVQAGDQAVFRVAVTKTSSFKKTITFDVPDLPPGSAAAVTAQSRSVYTLRINTSASANPGTSTYVLRGRSGTMERIGVFSLTVLPLPTTTSANPTTAPPTTKVGDFALTTNVQTRTVNPGEVASYTVIVTRQDFAGPVTFTMQGAPAGARADAAPNPTLLGTTLYLTTSTSTPSGTYLIVVTGSGGGNSHAIAVRLVVNRVGPFVLSLSPSSATVTAGNDAKATINVGRAGGSTVIPEVALSLQGAPAGVQIRTLTTVGATTQLVISTDASTAAGTYRLTVAGVSGSFRQGIVLTLTVVRDLPSFAISVTPQTVSTSQGSAGVFNVALTKTGGFAEPIGYSVRDLPPGATATVSTTADGSATISILTAKSTPATTYPMTIVAASGQRVSSVAVSLVVTAPAL